MPGSLSLDGRKHIPPDASATPIEVTYRGRTASSAALMERAAGSMPGGASRTFGFHHPYPVVIDHADGPFLWDVDGNQYVDLVHNGLSLIHGHAYPPITEALRPRAVGAPHAGGVH
jgi:glutamate-1-semialdehyde 2,1-aminomutase